MTTSSLTSRNMLQLLLRRPHVTRGCVVVAGHNRAASSSEASPKESGGGFFGTFFDRRHDISPQTTAHSAQLSMTKYGEFETNKNISSIQPMWTKFKKVL